MRLNKVIFIKNALILTVSGLFIRFLGMLFRVWLASAVGAEGMGLYSQIISFYALASAFASTGINTAVTRMVAEELATGNGKGAIRVLRRCMLATSVIATLSLLLIFFGSDQIAGGMMGDMRAADALRTLSFSLPFMGLSSCLKGYFIARKKTAPASSAQIFEQFIRIGLIMLIFTHATEQTVGSACRWILFGDLVAEACSFIFVYLSYQIDKIKHIVPLGGVRPQYSVFSRLRHIALPITAGRYVNSILRTAENLLVPRQLIKSGLSSTDALSVFGVIKGMALPLLLFPSTFLSALSTLLIPEMSDAAERGQTYKVRYTAEKCVHVTLISSLPVAVVFFFASRELGTVVYGDPEAGRLIGLLAPLIPLMYLDSVCDGLLKGLDQQGSIFRNSVLDSLFRLILIMFLLPRLGTVGFVVIMYLSNAFTCTANLWNLIKISSARIRWFNWLILPAVTALTSGTLVHLFISRFALPDLPFLLLFGGITAILYLFTTVKLGCITRDDLR